MQKFNAQIPIIRGGGSFILFCYTYFPLAREQNPTG